MRPSLERALESFGNGKAQTEPRIIERSFVFVPDTKI